MRTRVVADAVIKGIEYLHDKQRNDGALPLLIHDEKGSEFISWDSVFLPAFVMISLRNISRTETFKEHASRFLQHTQEDGRYWRFLGNQDPRDPDIDDTALALRALFDVGRISKEDVLDCLSNLKGYVPLPTYIRPFDQPNTTDRVVNANVLGAIQAAGGEHPMLASWLFSELQSGAWHSGSPYYHSPPAFLHALARCPISASEGRPFAETIRRAAASMLKTADDPFNLSQILYAWLQVGGSRDEALPHLQCLLEVQMDSGAWPSGYIFRRRTTSVYYGGSVVTTACAIEALSYFLN